MSLFEYAQEVVSRKLERKEPVLSVSMGMQPVMPMAQGGGLSSVQNSLNINGQPHRLAYINPNEEDLLKSLGGSGRKIDGIPAYDDSVDGGSNQGGPDNDSDPSSAEEGIGIGFDTSPAEAEAAVNAAQAEEAAVAAAIGEAEAYGNPEAQMNAPDLGFFGRGMTIDEQNFYDKANLSRQDPKARGFIDNINPYSFVFSPLATLAKAAVTTAQNNNFGMDPMGVVGNVGHAPSEDDDDDGTEAGGDDIIIREKIAAVKQIPVEEVEKKEVAKVKRLTSEERIAGTSIEEIIKEMYGQQMTNRLLNINRPTIEEEEENNQADLIDSIYGPGASAGLLGITTNNTGTA